MLTGAILFVSHPLIDLQIPQYLPQFMQFRDCYFIQYQKFFENGVFQMPDNLQQIHNSLCVISMFLGTRILINFLFSSSNHEEVMATYRKISDKILDYLDVKSQGDVKTKLKIEILDPRLAYVFYQLEFTSLFLEYFKAVRLILQHENYTSYEAVENCLEKIGSQFSLYSSYLTSIKDQSFQVVINQQQTTVSYTLLFKGLELQLLMAFREEFLRQQCTNDEAMNQIYQKITAKIYEVSDHLSNTSDSPSYLFCFYPAFYAISSAAQVHIERFTIQKSTSQSIEKEKEYLKKDLQSLELYMLRRFDKVQSLRFLYSKIRSCLAE